MKSMIITGTLITKETAPGYLKRIAKILQRDLTMEASVVLYDIESRIVKAGWLTWPEVEEIEVSAL